MEQKGSAPKGAQVKILANQLYSKSQRRREQIDRIKSDADYVRFYRPEIRDNRLGPDVEGWVVGGECPFGIDCQVGQFQVNLKTGRCRCQSCESETDALGYLMQRRGLKFPDALHFLQETG